MSETVEPPRMNVDSLPEPSPDEIADRKYLSIMKMYALASGMPAVEFPPNVTRREALRIYTELQRRVECLKLGLHPNTSWERVVPAQISNSGGVKYGRPFSLSRYDIIGNYLDAITQKKRAKYLALYESHFNL